MFWANPEGLLSCKAAFVFILSGFLFNLDKSLNQISFPKQKGAFHLENLKVETCETYSFRAFFFFSYTASWNDDEFANSFSCPQITLFSAQLLVWWKSLSCYQGLGRLWLFHFQCFFPQQLSRSLLGAARWVAVPRSSRTKRHWRGGLNGGRPSTTAPFHEILKVLEQTLVFSTVGGWRGRRSFKIRFHTRCVLSKYYFSYLKHSN